jgi:hypothetical protein
VIHARNCAQPVAADHRHKQKPAAVKNGRRAMFKQFAWDANRIGF